jgi:hypothetical protein
MGGQLDFYMPVEEWHLRAIWEGSGIGTTHPESMWHHISQYPFLHLDMTGYKFRRGFFKPNAWVGPLRFFFAKSEGGVDKEVHVGHLAATSVVDLFSEFDKWREARLVPAKDLDSALSRL